MCSPMPPPRTMFNSWAAAPVVFAVLVAAGLTVGTVSAEPPTVAAQAEPAPAEAALPSVTGIVATSDAADMARFLDRLMQAESGGNDLAKNPRSTALGPYQFIESTFLDVARRHFASETTALPPAQILALRTDRKFARRAAEAFTRDNAEQLAAHGLPASFANLRLAFLLGPAGAIRVLKSDATTPVINVVGVAVVQANPFMAGMTTRDLAAWSGRNLAAVSGRILSRDAGAPVAAAPAALSPPPAPVVVAKCNLSLASCRRWLAIATKQASARVASRQAPVRVGAKVKATATR